MTTHINVARDFNSFPFGRYPTHGEWSGERFREELLVPAMEAHEPIEVDLDGARGLSPSFLEEAFGGLVRKGYASGQVLSRLRIKSERDPSLIALITDYIRAVH